MIWWLIIACILFLLAGPIIKGIQIIDRSERWAEDPAYDQVRRVIKKSGQRPEKPSD